MKLYMKFSSFDMLTNISSINESIANSCSDISVKKHSHFPSSSHVLLIMTVRFHN